MKFVPVDVYSITLDPESNSPILILKEKGGDKTLPIWIGLLEATAIATEMEKIEFSRPMTHDLAMSIVKAVDGSISRVAITDLQDNTYYALISLVVGDKVIEVDSRPSDAVALALRAQAEIFVNEAIIDRPPGQTETILRSEDLTDEKQRWADILEEIDPDIQKYKM